MHVRKGDTVAVISGNDKGKRGTVRAVLIDKNRVIVEGVNLRWKHRKPSQKNPKGERVQNEAPIHASNVMFVDPKSGEPTRHRGARATAKPAKADGTAPAEKTPPKPGAKKSRKKKDEA